MPSYKTPGVYVEEISTLPGSIVAVPTAIPAFIGYTEYAQNANGVSLQMKPTSINSLEEYHTYFGREYEPTDYTVTLNGDDLDTVFPDKRFYLYESIRLFYDNGGGTCFIVSVGDYSVDEVILEDVGDPAIFGLKDGLLALEEWDEPTLILFPDAVGLLDGNTPGYAGLGDLQKAALAQCEDLKDRFVIMDIMEGFEEGSPGNPTPVDLFRQNVGINFLNYGAVYHPWVQTNFNYELKYYQLNGASTTGAIVELADDIDVLLSAIYTVLDNSNAIDTTTLQALANPSGATSRAIQFLRRKNFQNLHANFYQAAVNAALQAPTDQNRDNLLAFLSNAAALFSSYNTNDRETEVRDILNGYENDSTLQAAITDLGDDTIIDQNATGNAIDIIQELETRQIANVILSYLSNLLSKIIEFEEVAEGTLFTNDPLFSQIQTSVIGQLRAMPPSGAMAGVYAQTDNSRGVFKAPANVSVNSISGPSFVIDDEDQSDLNVHPSGKSVNAIRTFINKGTLVWGARTLAGNDNEWRYVPVRRFFIFAEESIKKALEPFVFEPNDANTWSKVRAMITNFLTQQWQAGALFGAKPEEAFFVNIGLGESMTPVDILEGRLIVEIGMAAVRPAEFIILRFSHKLAEA